MGVPPQGDLQLFDGEMTKRLLNSTIPARIASVAKDGSAGHSYVVLLGRERSRYSYVHCRSARASRYGAPCSAACNPAVALTIDTEGFPPEVLLIRG